MTILYFLIVLGLLIFIHEFGHFIMAKRASVYVETFSMGFGPRLFGFKRGETDYCVSLLPFGGYVKMRGEDPNDPEAVDPKSFAAKSLWQRVKVVAFGPLMNFILCIVLMPVVFMIGRTEPVYIKETPVIIGVFSESPAEKAGLTKGDRILTIDGKDMVTWEDVITKIILSQNKTLKIGYEHEGMVKETSLNVGEIPEFRGGFSGIEPMWFFGEEAKIDGVEPRGPADQAGLKHGDKIVAVNGDKITSRLEMLKKINALKGGSVTLSVERDGNEFSVNVTPTYNKEYDAWLIGIITDRRAGVPTVFKRYGLIDAVIEGTKENIKLTWMTLDVLKNLVTANISYKMLGGPVMIAKVSAAAAASGLSDFLYFLAFMSLQLSILNILPIPVLDGGHLLFMGIEAVFRRPVSPRVRGIADQVGFVALISFMLLVTFNDIDSMWGIKDFIKKIF